MGTNDGSIRMNMTVTTLATALLMALLPAAASAQNRQPGQKKLYCWNENGAKVCGDALPASAADSARVEISGRSGMPTKRVARALSPEERSQAAAQQRIDSQNAATAAAAQRRDMAMVESYATEAELLRAFQHRITLLDETVKASRFSIAGIRQSLVSLLKRASEAELYGKPVDTALAGDIHQQHQALRRQEQLLGQQYQDRDHVSDELAAALARYRAMKQPASAQPAAATPTG